MRVQSELVSAYMLSFAISLLACLWVVKMLVLHTLFN